jgi:hypothetical protein
LSDIVLLPMPDYGVVTLSNPDGAYWKCLEKDSKYPGIKAANVIIIGPMKFCPLDYETALRRIIGDGYELYAAEFLPGLPDSKELRRVALLRGCVSLKFACLPTNVTEVPSDLLDLPRYAAN